MLIIIRVEFEFSRYKMVQLNDILYRNIKQNLMFPTKKQQFSARFARLLIDY